jgi:hypothetical protein
MSVFAVFCLSFVCVRETVLTSLFWLNWVDCVSVFAAVWDFVFEQGHFFHLLFASPAYAETVGSD